MEIRINREVRNYHESIFFGLSAHSSAAPSALLQLPWELIFCSKTPSERKTQAGCVCSVPRRWRSLDFSNTTGLSFERLLWAMFKTHILCAGRRLYKSENLYDQLLHIPEKKVRKRK